MTSQELAQITPLNQMLSDVRTAEFQAQLRQALPENVTVERFERVTSTALMQTPALAQADRKSLFAAIIRAAQDGLYPDGKEAALVIFGNAVAYMPMVGGFRKIAAEYGWTIHSAVVYEHDEFDYSPTTSQVWHKPPKLGSARGHMIGAYALGKHRDGRTVLEVMDAVAIEKVRNVSRTKASGPWKEWPERMWEKTPVRRLFAKLPLDPADKRIERVLNATDIEPSQATAMLYPPARPALAQASTQDPPAARGASPAASQQAGEGEATEASAAATGAPSAAPGDDEPEPEPEPVDEDDANVFTAAALTVFPNGQHQGKSLAEIADLGESGANYLWWALRQSQYQGDFRTALEAYVREAGIVHSERGELWAAYEQWLAEKAAA